MNRKENCVDILCLWLYILEKKGTMVMAAAITKKKIQLVQRCLNVNSIRYIEMYPDYGVLVSIPTPFDR